MKDPFAVLARCLGVVCVLISLAWSTNLLTLAGYHGLLDPDLAQVVSASLPLSLYHFIQPGPGFDMALVILTNLLALFGAALWWKPRSVLLTLGLYLSLVTFKQTVPLIAYGVFEFMQLGLFYVLSGNVARFFYSKSLDGGWQAERLVGWFARGHIAMGYLFAGLCKAVGPQWWTGDSMWRALARSDYSGQRWFDTQWTSHAPLLLQIAGVVTLAAESLYFLSFWKKPRMVLVPTMMLMHLGTIAAQGLTLFGLTMISLNGFFWLESNVRRPQEGEETDPEPEKESELPKVAAQA
jgi:hypothetical protein